MKPITFHGLDFSSSFRRFSWIFRVLEVQRYPIKSERALRNCPETWKAFLRKTHRRRLQALPKMQHLPMLVLRIRVAEHFKRVSSEVPHVRWRT